MSAEPGDDRLLKLLHDLRTPLTVIAGFAELLERGGEQLTDEQRAEYLSRITSSALELREIVDAEHVQGPRQDPA